MMTGAGEMYQNDAVVSPELFSPVKPILGGTSPDSLTLFGEPGTIRVFTINRSV